MSLGLHAGLFLFPERAEELAQVVGHLFGSFVDRKMAALMICQLFTQNLWKALRKQR